MKLYIVIILILVPLMLLPILAVNQSEIDAKVQLRKDIIHRQSKIEYLEYWLAKMQHETDSIINIKDLPKRTVKKFKQVQKIFNSITVKSTGIPNCCLESNLEISADTLTGPIPEIKKPQKRSFLSRIFKPKKNHK